MADYGLPLDMSNEEVAIMVESGLNWLDHNTTLNIDREAELPANVKLFLVKFCDLMGQTYGVASESLGGMSQTFSTSGGTGFSLVDLASQLFGSAYKGRNRFVSAANRWK